MEAGTADRPLRMVRRRGRNPRPHHRARERRIVELAAQLDGRVRSVQRAAGSDQRTALPGWSHRSGGRRSHKRGSRREAEQAAGRVRGGCADRNRGNQRPRSAEKGRRGDTRRVEKGLPGTQAGTPQGDAASATDAVRKRPHLAGRPDSGTRSPPHRVREAEPARHDLDGRGQNDCASRARGRRLLQVTKTKAPTSLLSRSPRQ